MNLNQTIAEQAYALVRAQTTAPFQKSEAEYRAWAESFPVLLRTAGLLQGASFLKAKRGTLYDHVSQQFRGIQMLGEDEDLAGLLANTRRVPMHEYRFYCLMADRIAYWHKRMAQAYLRTRKEGADEKVAPQAGPAE